jgi:hypothetical protein
MGYLYITRNGKTVRYGWITAVRKEDERTLCVIVGAGLAWATVHNVEAAEVLPE